MVSHSVHSCQRYQALFSLLYTIYSYWWNFWNAFAARHFRMEYSLKPASNTTIEYWQSTRKGFESFHHSLIIDHILKLNRLLFIARSNQIERSEYDNNEIDRIYFATRNWGNTNEASIHFQAFRSELNETNQTEMALNATPKRNDNIKMGFFFDHIFTE